MNSHENNDLLEMDQLHDDPVIDGKALFLGAAMLCRMSASICKKKRNDSWSVNENTKVLGGQYMMMAHFHLSFAS